MDGREYYLVMLETVGRRVVLRGVLRCSQNVYPVDRFPPCPRLLVEHNVYRAHQRKIQAQSTFLLPFRYCYAECRSEGIVRISAELHNQGFDSIRDEVPLALYRKDGTSLTFLSSALTDDRINAGQRGASVEFETNDGAIEGADALVVRADDWGAGFGLIQECDEWNNGVDFVPSMRIVLSCHKTNKISD